MPAVGEMADKSRLLIYLHLVVLGRGHLGVAHLRVEILFALLEVASRDGGPLCERSDVPETSLLVLLAED